jgi:hypothetical protein
MTFVDTTKDLCETCLHAYKGGCPVWPPMRLVIHCVEYGKRGSSPTSKK